MSGNIIKLACASFFTGLVLWYGIEKSFMLSIGISVFSIGLAVVLLQALAVALEIPAGLLSDRWHRKRVLMVSTAVLAAGALVMGSSDSFGVYCVGVVLYAVHVVTWFTTCSALIYDTLCETKETDKFSRYWGKVASLNFVGYAAAGFAGSWLFSTLGDYRRIYIVAAAPALLAFLLVVWLTEPVRHKVVITSGHPVRDMIHEVWQGSKKVAALGAIRALFGIMCLLWITEAFKEGFGQLYFLKYADELPLPDWDWLNPEPVTIASALFGLFYGIWALSGWTAHLFKNHMNLLVFGSVVPILVMAFVDNWISVVAFMVQAFMVPALFIHIEAHIHDVTPSSIRASVMSVRTFAGRAVSIAALPFIAKAMESGNAIGGVRVIAPFAAATLLIWLFAARKRMAARPQTVAPIASRSC